MHNITMKILSFIQSVGKNVVNKNVDLFYDHGIPQGCISMIMISMPHGKQVSKDGFNNFYGNELVVKCLIAQNYIL